MLASIFHCKENDGTIGAALLHQILPERSDTFLTDLVCIYRLCRIYCILHNLYSVLFCIINNVAPE